MGNISILSREEIGRDYTEARTLKRKLNNGDWVYVSEENQLLVLSDEVARQINSSELIEEEVLNELVENKIMIKKADQRDDYKPLFVEPKNILFKSSSFLIDVNGIVAFTISIFLFVIKGSPFGSAVNVLFTNPLKFLLIAILVSIVSTTFHEFMHIIFSRNSRKINLNIVKAVATIPMTHVWTWSRFGRITVITSGMSSDAIFLLVFLIMNNKSVGVNSIAASILITRILWQFIIIQKTDINILISFVVDNPFYFEEVAIMKLIIIKVISISVLVMIIWLWFQPVINQFN